MKNLFKRAVLGVSSGYILMYYGEILFWATPDRKGMTLDELFSTWIVYSMCAYIFLCAVSLSKARSLWAVFLAGAFFGWFVEGIVEQTLYDMFPLNLAWTGLAWHALLGVSIGWCLVRRVLAENSFRKTTLLAASIGLFYGFWAIFWWTDSDPDLYLPRMFSEGQKDIMLFHFSIFSFLSTAFVIAAYWLYNRQLPFSFRVSKIELWILGALTLAFYVFVSVPANWLSLVVLPPLMGITLLALRKNALVETDEDAISAPSNKVESLNYLLLFLIPLVASLVYFLALSAGAKLSTNVIVVSVSVLAGTALWLVSLVKLLVTSRGDQPETIK